MLEIEEKVMVFPAEILEQLGIPDKFSKDFQKYYDGIFKQENIHFVPRSEAETNESWKQIIPYQVLQSNESYFVYRRGHKGGEDRLYNFLSLGIGGHINRDDSIGSFSTKEIYNKGASRELDEEIKLPNTYTYHDIGVIYDNSTKVGRVHFGFLRVIDVGLDKDTIAVVDQALDFVGWFTKDALIAFKNNFETWSAIVIDNLLD